MTDLTSKNNYYYSAFQYNSSTIPVQAQVDEALLYPLLETSSDYQVAVSKAEIDLSTIPLTQYNIPLKAFQVGLRDGTNVQTAYVRQLNGSTLNYIYNITPAGLVSKYSYMTTPTPSVTYISGTDLSSFFQTIGAFFVDDYENYYILGSQIANALIFDTFSAFTPTGNVLQTLSFPSITCCTIDLRQNVYLGVDNGSTSVVQIYSNANGINTVALSQTGTLTQDKNANPLYAIETVCVDGQIVVGYNQNNVTIYNSDTLVAQSTFINTDVTTFGRPSAILTSSDRFVLTNRGASTRLFGQVLSTGNVVDMTTDASFVSGSWDQGSQLCITNYGAGYGVTGGLLLTFGYDFATGVSSAPIPSGYLTTVSNCSNGVLGSDITATDSSLLYYLAPLGVSTSLFPVQVSSVFNISGSVQISAYSYQASTGNVVAVGSDNNLYKSSIPIYPKMFVVNNSATETTSYLPVSLNTYPSLNTVSGNVISSTIPNVAGETVVSSYIEGAFMFVLSTYLSSGNTYANVYKYNYPLGTLVATVAYNTLDLVDINMCQSSTVGATAITYNSVSSGTVVELLDVAGNAVLAGATLPVSIPLVNRLSICSSPTTSDGYNVVCVSDGVSFYVYNYTAPSTFTALATAPFPGLSTVQGLFFTQIPNSSSLLTRLVAVGDTNKSSLMSFTNGFAGVNASIQQTLPYNLTPTLVGTVGITPFTNSVFQEGYVQTVVPSGGVNLTAIELADGYATIASNIITLPLGTTSFCVAPSLDGLFTFSALTPTGIEGSNHITCVCVDSVHPSLVYCCDSAGVVYSGYLNGTGIAFSPVTNPTINGTYQTVNAVPVPTTTVSAEAFTYSISSQTREGEYIPPSGNFINSISRNNISDEFILNYGTTTLSLPPATLSPSISIPVPNAFITWTKNGQDVSAGNAPIMTMSVLVNAINTAFLECYAKFVAGSITECPFLTLDYATGLLTLNYAVDMSSVPATKFILMNPLLLQYCKFSNSIDTAYPYLNDISPIPLNSTSLTQTAKSLYLFNQLDKIVFISNTIYVFGSFFGNNNTNNIITDIDVPINSAGYVDNVGQTLYYQPSFLRPYILSSSNALQRVQLYVNYVYKDNTQYPLMIDPSTNWNCKLIFPRRF